MSTGLGGPAADDDGDYQISYYSDGHIEHKRMENIEKELTNMKHGLHGIYNMVKCILAVSCFLLTSIVILNVILLVKASAASEPFDAPVGTITAWTMKVEVQGPEAGGLPRGWVRCRVLNESSRIFAKT